VFTAREIDDLCELVLAQLLADGATAPAAAHDLVAHLAAHRPDTPALAPVLPLSMAAASLEGMLAGPEARARADGAWRMAAMIGAEVLALQAEAGGASAPRIGALFARMQAQQPWAAGAAAANPA
jgi:hypothetical protein